MRPPAANLSNARGALTTTSAYSFTSDYFVVPFDGILADYSITTAHPGLVFATAFTVVSGTLVQAYFRQMPGIRPLGMRVHPVGMARSDWVPVAAGTLMYVEHRDEGGANYPAETNGAADSARVTMTFRPQEAFDVYSNAPLPGNLTRLGTSFARDLGT